MSELKDVIIKDSNKQFRLRITGFLRAIGVSQIIGTKEYLEIEFIGGELSVRVLYPRNLGDLNKQVNTELLTETNLMPNEIDNIRYYIDEHIEEIENTLKEIKNIKNN
ncbi:hypothetical protein NMY3_03047 [Candidatus Nitrosocosmicus oleophilus]|uniref:Uncharacterized protein n=1 Tax=Candidatus Nitrosocosmicus oleophilus TaxID=1353260 RepID=A0A654M079_9ARCH|nr:hypothetical protein [Candidatus Nitrosocosmicus oleophilus]ALI37234.1 hypothetical protein NMY3_03047 [Candidatus Nitrosocosmicus oleophilus]